MSIPNSTTHEFVLELLELDFSFQEYSVLRGELTDKELDELDNIKSIAGKLKKLFNFLNDKKRLPIEYKDRVKEYNGFEGKEIDFDILI